MRTQEKAMTPKQRAAAQAAVLGALHSDHTVSKAAREAKVSRAAVYEWLSTTHLRGRVGGGVGRGRDVLVQEAIRRAVDGVDEPLTYRGEVFGTVRKFLGRAADVPDQAA
jgi:hypothetical protein